MYKMVEKANHVVRHTLGTYFFMQISALQIFPKLLLEELEIKDTVTADRIRANNLMINPYLEIQTVGTVIRQW